MLFELSRIEGDLVEIQHVTGRTVCDAGRSERSTQVHHVRLECLGRGGGAAIGPHVIEYPLNTNNTARRRGKYGKKPAGHRPQRVYDIVDDHLDRPQYPHDRPWFRHDESIRVEPQSCPSDCVAVARRSPLFGAIDHDALMGPRVDDNNGPAHATSVLNSLRVVELSAPRSRGGFEVDVARGCLSSVWTRRRMRCG